MHRKRFVGIMLSLCLILGMYSFVQAANPITEANIQNSFDRLVSAGFIKNANIDDQLTRANFAVLMNLIIAQSEMSDQIFSFTDVKPSDAYYLDIAKALAAGYMSGTSTTTFNPHGYINREQAVTAIGRMLGLNISNLETSVTLAFSDAKEVSSWAAPYYTILFEMGAINTVNGKLSPKSVITYGEAAFILEKVINDLLPEGQVLVADTVYYYDTKANININGITVWGTEIPGTGIYYYAANGQEPKGTLYGTKDMTFAEFWYGEIEEVNDQTSTRTAKYLNYGNSELTEDIYAGQQKETWDNDSGMYDAITRATVGYGIYRAAFIHSVELTRNDGTKELYSHEIYRDPEVLSGFTVELNTTGVEGIAHTANTRLDASKTKNYTLNTKNTYYDNIAAGGGGYIIKGIRNVPVSVDAARYTYGIILKDAGVTPKDQAMQDFMVAANEIKITGVTPLYGMKHLHEAGVFGPRNTSSAEADYTLTGTATLGNGENGTKPVAHGDGYADLTMYIYLSDFENYIKGSIITLDEATLDTLYARDNSTFAQNLKTGTETAAFMDYALKFYGAKLQWAGEDGMFDTADDMVVGNMLHKDAYYSFNHGHYIEVSITRDFERFAGLGDGNYRIVLMSSGYTDVVVDAYNLVLDYSTPVLTDEDVQALGNGNSFSVEVDASAVNVTKDVQTAQAYLAALGNRGTYSFVISNKLSVPCASVVDTGTNKYIVTFTLDDEAKAALVDNTLYRMKIAAGVDGVDDCDLTIHYAPQD